jgi:simple sugar transport system substrate-binding protein
VSARGAARLCLGLLSLGALFSLGGCAKQPQAEQPREIIVGFAQLGAESGWRVGNTADIERAAQRAHVQLMYKNADQRQDNQIKAIRSFIASQVDVIAFAPIVEEGWDNVLREAKEAGIPVLLTDRFIRTEDESLYAGFVGSNFLQEGQAAAQFLLQKTAGQNHVRILQITGTEDSTPMKQRQQGFEQTIAGDSRYEIFQTISGDFLRSKGKECMRNVLRETRDIGVLYSHNDAMTLGAIEAIEEAGLVPGEDIVIITVDGEQGAIDLLKQGKINCVVECTPLIGDVIMDLAKKLAAGEPIARITYSSERTFTEYDSDLQALPPRGY